MLNNVAPEEEMTQEDINILKKIRLEKLDERRIGQLLFFLEMSTAASGELLNINAFNQEGTVVK